MRMSRFLGSALVLAFFASCMLLRAQDPSYKYPLKPGTPEWGSATVAQRIQAATVPKSYKDYASPWGLFLTAVKNPYFRSILAETGDGKLATAYAEARQTPILTIISDAESAPGYGDQAFKFLHTANIQSMMSVPCSQFTGFCEMDYVITSYMASTDNSLNTMAFASRGTLFRIATWDANYFNSVYQQTMACAAVKLMYVIYNKPESFRGAFPAGVNLPTLSADQQAKLEAGSFPPELVPVIASVKSALGLVARP